MPANHQQTVVCIFTPFGPGNSQQYPNLTASTADYFSRAQKVDKHLCVHKGPA